MFGRKTPSEKWASISKWRNVNAYDAIVCVFAHCCALSHFCRCRCSEFNDVSYLLGVFNCFFFILSMHAVIRSLTKNYCVFSFIVHSCKLQCLKCSVDECTYAQEEREKNHSYICAPGCVLFLFCPTLDPCAQFLGYFLVSNWARIRKEWEGYLS